MSRRVTGLTLIELLVAVGLGMVLMAMAWEAFIRTRDATARTSARVNLHATAAVLEDALRRDLSNMAPALACFARSTVDTSDPSVHVETVELLLMRTTSPLDKLNSVPGTFDGFLADHFWVRWRLVRTLKPVGAGWVVSTSRLLRSESTPVRTWKTTTALTVSPAVVDPALASSKTHYGGVFWLNIARPLRDGTSWGIDGLTHNRYGVPAAKVDTTTPIGDIDDLADLDLNERTASTQVRSFSVGWSDAGGQSVAAHPGTAADIRRNGLYMDVVGPDNGLYPSAAVTLPVAAQPQYDYRSDLARRPRVVRISLALRDDATGVAQDFSFSVATPGQGPASIRPCP